VHLEMATVASQIVAEIYQGIDFPIGWADKSDAIDLGMARELLVSVAAMFDDALQPIALCWCVSGREERFVHAQPDDPDGSLLLEELHRDLAEESLRLGAADLFATMVWAPDDLRPDQGQSVRRIAFIAGRFGSMRGWNIPTRTLVSSARNLLLMTRRIDQGVAFPMPTSIEEMRERMGSGESKILIVLPGSVASVAEKNVGRKMAILFSGLIVLSALITAYILNRV